MDTRLSKRPADAGPVSGVKVRKGRAWLAALAAVGIVLLILAGLLVALRSLRSATFPVRVTRLSAGGGLNPIWCGDRILFCPAYPGAQVQNGIYWTRSNGGPPGLVLRGDWVLQDYDPASDQVYTVSKERLFIFPLKRPWQIRQVPCGLRVISTAVSRAGTVAILVSHGHGVSNIGILDARKGRVRMVTRFVREEDCPNTNVHVEWSQDEGQIGFVRTKLIRQGRLRSLISRSTWFVNIKSGALTPAPSSVPGGFAANRTDDRIAYGRWNELLVFKPGKGARIVARNYSRGGYKSISWSPDGKWIAYDGSDGNVWVVKLGNR